MSCDRFACIEYNITNSSWHFGPNGSLWREREQKIIESTYDLPVFTLITHPKWDPLIPLIFERTIFFDFARCWHSIDIAGHCLVNCIRPLTLILHQFSDMLKHICIFRFVSSSLTEMCIPGYLLYNYHKTSINPRICIVKRI